MPKFLIVSPLNSPSSSAVDFSEFVGIVKGLSISSAAASSAGGRGADFLELGLSRTFNLRLQASGNTLVVSLISTINRDEFAPVRLEIIGRNETVTAERLQGRLHSLRQVYATALLLEDGREDELAGVLHRDSQADIEHELVAEEDKLVVLDAGAGSLVLSLIAKTKKTYQALLYACAVPFAEGRKALLGRVEAGTALAALEVQAKSQDLRLKGAHGLLDLAKKLDSIKDEDTRELIRQRLFSDVVGLAATEAPTSNPLALEYSTALTIPLNPVKVGSQAEPIKKLPQRDAKPKRAKRR